MERNQDIWVFLADSKQLTKAAALHFFFSTLTSEEGSSGPLSLFPQCPLAGCLKDTIFHNTARIPSRQGVSKGSQSDSSGAVVKGVQQGRLLHRPEASSHGRTCLPRGNTLSQGNAARQQFKTKLPRPPALRCLSSDVSQFPFSLTIRIKKKCKRHFWALV